MLSFVRGWGSKIEDAFAIAKGQFGKPTPKAPLADIPQSIPKKSVGVWWPEPDLRFEDFSPAKGPTKLMFSLTGKCNLRCAHCARGLWEIPAQQTPASLVDYVLEEIVPNVCAVRLGGTDLGEQLTSRHFDRFLRGVAKYPDIHVEVVTNLTVMNEERARLIVDTCDRFCVSMEGIGDGYEKVRGFPWERLKRNLHMLLNAWLAAEKSNLHIHALITCFRDNLYELEPTLDLRLQGVRSFIFRHFRPKSPEQEAQCLSHYPDEANKVFDEIRRIAAEKGLSCFLPDNFPVEVEAPAAAQMRPVEPEPPESLPAAVSSLDTTVSGKASSGMNDPDTAESGGSPPNPPWTCPFPFETISILSDGEIGTCCENVRLGRLNLEKPDLQAVWAGRPFEELRRSQRTGQWKGPCVNCEHRRRN